MSNEPKFNKGGLLTPGLSLVTNTQILCEYLVWPKQDDDEPTAPNV